MKNILILTGDGGESYETLYAKHRFEEAEYTATIAAPSKKLLNLVMHDFEPGWDTYVIEYQLDKTSGNLREDKPFQLPNVGGRFCTRSNAELERAFLIYLAKEQEKGDFSDNALIALLCDGVRLTREYSDWANKK